MSKKQRIFLTVAVAYLIYNIVQNGLNWGNGLVTVLVLASLYLSARYGNRKKSADRGAKTGKKSPAGHASERTAQGTLKNSGKHVPKV